MGDEAPGRGGSASVARYRSPSALVAFTACAHRTELERAAEAKLVAKPRFPNAALEALVERGREHERAYLAELRARGLEIVEIGGAPPATGAQAGTGATLADDLAEAARLTTEAMRRGVAVIYQATFLQTDPHTDPGAPDGGAAAPATWRGHVDFLQRVERPVETPSALGAWSYEPWDAKLAREARAAALLQLCAYAEMIERVQGTAPASVHLVLGGPARPIASYRLASIAPYYRQVRREFLARVVTPRPPVFPVADPYPDPVEHCEVCDWSPLCEQRRRADDHVSLVAGISRTQRKALHERGITTLTGLASATMPLDPPLERTRVPAMTRVREQARVQREGREQGQPVWELILGPGNPVAATGADTAAAAPTRARRRTIEHKMGLGALPAPSPGDLFFDIEGDPFVGDGGREYLFGVAAADGYQAFWSFDAAGEKARFEEVVDLFHARLRADPDLHVYHFASYETAALKRLAGRLGTRVDEVDDLLRREIFVDLFRVVRQGIRASVESYSIKKLEVLYGFRREAELRAAGDARATLERWLEAPRPEPLPNHAELCALVEAYNREDCQSASRLRDWLEARRGDLEATLGHPVPRPVRKDPTQSEESTELKARIAAVKERLTAGVPADPAERSPAQQGRWLLAQLVEWHAREDKSAWWDYFRMLRELSDEDMVEDPKGLGGITYVGAFGLTATKRSTIHRYRFEPQDHDLEAGDRCDARAPGLEPRADGSADAKPPQLTLHAFDDVNGTFDVTRDKKSPPPAIGALIPRKIIGTDDHRARLLALAEWVAEHGIEVPGDHRLARDLLLRAPPCTGAKGANLVQPGENAQDAAVRLVLELARTSEGASLPIQGPPGAGKTHTAVQILLALVAAGFRVGITGPNHRVISDVLEKACGAAREASRDLKIVQKGGDDGAGALADPFVTVAESNDAVAALLQSGESQIAAGTTWLWADPALVDAVDVLLVDEAGQLSLANAVAIADATRNLVLLGDPRQLDQPRKGVHPDGAEVSVLEHLSPGTFTIPLERGVFLNETRRLHPALCRFTSEMFYDGRLLPMAGTERQALHADALGRGPGIHWWPVDHEGNQNDSPEEVAAVKDLFDRLLGGQARWTDRNGKTEELTVGDIVVVAPYNAQVRLLKAALPERAKVGTVDKFQGTEAAVAIYSMTTSTPEDAPRGMEFLYSLNRLNVATSRAKVVAIVVASPALLRPACKTPRQMELAAGLCAVVEWGMG